MQRGAELVGVVVAHAPGLDQLGRREPFEGSHDFRGRNVGIELVRKVEIDRVDA